MRTPAPGNRAWILLVMVVSAACSGATAQGEQVAPVAASAPTTTAAAVAAALPAASSTTTTSSSPGRSTTTTTVSGTTSSTTSSSTSTTTVPALRLATLAEGDTGPDVVTLQRMLNNATGSLLRPNGIFGPETTLAITNLQRYAGLLVTNVADHETRVLLAELDAGRSSIVPTWPVPSLGNGGADGCQVAVVGDSLMAGAAALHEAALASIGCASAVDGVGGRSLNFGWQCRVAQPDGDTPLLLMPEPEPGNTTCAPSGLELLQLWARGGALGDLVVVALGTNDAGIHTDEATWIAHWDRALALTGDRPVMFLTTAARPGSRRVASQDVYSAALRRWCDARDRCHLADWALSPGALDPGSYVDAVHLRRSATELRAAFVADAVKHLLTAPPAPDPTPLPATTTTSSTTTTTSTTTTSTTTTLPATTTSTTTTLPATTTSTTTTSTTTTSTTTTLPATTTSTTTTSTTTTSPSTTTSSTTTVPMGE